MRGNSEKYGRVAGYLTVMVPLPVAVAAVLGVACVRAIMMRGTR